MFRNTHGTRAAVHILDIGDGSRGHEGDELRLRYVIQMQATPFTVADDDHLPGMVGSGRTSRGLAHGA